MKYFDAFEDWAGEAARFEPVAPPMRRLEPITVTWRGEVHRFEPTHPLVFGRRTTGSRWFQIPEPVVGAITIWPPTANQDHLFPRSGWTADVRVENFGFMEGKGATAQEALDALSAELPAAPMVRGGSC